MPTSARSAWGTCPVSMATISAMREMPSGDLDVLTGD